MVLYICREIVSAPSSAIGPSSSCVAVMMPSRAKQLFPCPKCDETVKEGSYIRRKPSSAGSSEIFIFKNERRLFTRCVIVLPVQLIAGGESGA